MLLPFSNTHARVWNPDASGPLVLPLVLKCNSSDEMVFANVRANSAVRGRHWLNTMPAHDQPAVICGSGPSLAETLPEIRARQEAGATVFALNGAAAFLDAHGIHPDYQIILDARPQTVALVGPAKKHLFASQVDPALFDKVPDAILWHVLLENLEELLPGEQPECVWVGGAASVGITALTLVYAMGHRQLDLYGYDSSHRGITSHAFRQPINDEEGAVWINWNGKEYLITLCMKAQAERFQTHAVWFQRNCGVSINVHGTGLLPDMWNTPPEQLTEQAKYERMWAIPAYRSYAPGLASVETFFEVVRPADTVIDFGSGSGRAAKAIAERGVKVVLVDFAVNSRDDDLVIQQLPFMQLDLAEPMPLRAPYGYCSDVMEHIPPDQVASVLANIMASAETVFFQISTLPDAAGALINQQLHLTIEPHGWWLALAARLGYAIRWERELPGLSQFVAERS